MAHTQRFLDAYDLTVRQRVLVALVNAATQIQGESQAGFVSPFAKWTKRQALSNAVLNNASGYLERFALAVCATGAVTVASSDAAIDTAVASVFDDIAGVTIVDT